MGLQLPKTRKSNLMAEGQVLYASAHKVLFPAYVIHCDLDLWPQNVVRSSVPQ